MNNIKLTILGGDYRYKILKDLLEKENFQVSSYANPHINSEDCLDKSLINANAVICPIPITKNNKLNIEEKYNINEIELLNSMLKNNVNLLIGGVIPSHIHKNAKGLKIKTIDLFSLESLAIKNAIPTAEGAIMIAMEESDKVLFNSNTLVIGYGRCGKILSKYLKAIGSNVSITYRNLTDMAYIEAYGYTPLNILNLKSNLKKYDIVFNTAPSMILNKDMLEEIKKETIIIDLSQAPGGVDYTLAKELGIKALYCPGLPGRVAPFTAAQIIKDSILDIIKNS